MTDTPLTNEQSAFLKQFPKKTYEKGEIIIHQGDDLKNVYFLAKGDCCRKIITESGEEVIYDRRTAGNTSNDFIAAIYCYIINKTSYFIYETENGCELNVIPHADFISFLNQNPELMHGLLFRICNNYNQLNMNFLSKRSNKTSAYISAILLSSAEDINGKFFVDKKLTITEISRRSGTHRVTVSKIISRLLQEEVIVKTSRGFQILDKKTLFEYSRNLKKLNY